MINRILFCCLTGLLILPCSTLAVDFMYRGRRGIDYFSCGSERRGGVVGVKFQGDNNYRIYGKRFSGVINLPEDTSGNDWCGGIIGVARIACGECKMPHQVQKKIK